MGCGTGARTELFGQGILSPCLAARRFHPEKHRKSENLKRFSVYELNTGELYDALELIIVYNVYRTRLIRLLFEFRNRCELRRTKEIVMNSYIFPSRILFFIFYFGRFQVVVFLIELKMFLTRSVYFDYESRVFLVLQYIFDVSVV